MSTSPPFLDYQSQLLQEILRLCPVPEGTVLPEGLELGRPPKREMGDLALGVFPLSKSMRKSPKEIAERWAEAVRAELALGDKSRLAGLPIPVRSVSAAGPYVNLGLCPAAMARLVVQSIVAHGPEYGRGLPDSGETVMVEYSSPNTNKPLHLGHVRNNLLGMSLSNILQAVGNKVIRVNLVNDRGIHICKSMLAYRRWGQGGTPQSTGEKGDHFVGRYYVLFDRHLKDERHAYAQAQGVDLLHFGKEAQKNAKKEDARRLGAEEERFEERFLQSSALLGEAREMLRLWEAGDADVLSLWRTMNGWVYEGFRQTYGRLGCRFDRWYFESETYQLGKTEVERGLQKGVFYRKEDGSVWARLEPLGLKDKVLLRSDGTSVYITQDLGTAIRKFEDYHMDRSIYVVGSEQDDHFRNLFAMLKLLGHPWAERCYHASYGLVMLPKGMGKLKSREGTAVDADDLLDELKELARQKIAEGGFCEDPAAIGAIAEQIGQGALKLYILQVGAEKNIQFDPTESISFTGDTGAAVQYSHARIHGILRKGLAAGKVSPDDLSEASAGPFFRPDRADPSLLLQPEEQEVLQLLSDFPQVVALAARQLSAAPVANYLLELTKAYARAYQEHHVLRAQSEDLLRARLQLGLVVAQVLKSGLALLTIEAPDRM